MSVQNFKIKHGLNLGDQEIIDIFGNIKLPSGATISVGGLPFNSYTPPTDQGAGNFLSGDGTYKAVTVPTSVSQLSNDVGYITGSALPTSVSQLSNDVDYQTSNQVAQAISNIVNSAPATLDTLNELANALGNDENFATSIITQLGLKANASEYLPLTGGVITNGLIIGTQSVDNFNVGVDYSFVDSFPGSIQFYGSSERLNVMLNSLNPGAILTIDGHTITVINSWTDYLVYSGPYLPQVNIISIPGIATGSLEVKGPITQLGNTVLHTGNINNYALSLNGGALNGPLQINQPGAVGGTFPAIELLGNQYSGGMSLGVIQNTDRTGATIGVTYFDSIGGKAISFGVDGIEKMKMEPNGSFNVIGALTQNGYQVLHSNNYSDYTYAKTQIDSSLALKANLTGADFTGNISSSGSISAVGGTVTANILTANSYLNAPAASIDGNISIGGNIDTSSSSISIANTTATTVNIAGASTATYIGSGSGSTTIGNHLIVTGNLTVQGDQIINNTSTMEIEDPLIYIGTGNVGNSNDIGFVGHFTSGTYQHTGLVRDASDNKWRLFSGVTSEPSGSTLDFTNAIPDALQIGGLTATNGDFSGNLNVTGTINRSPTITLGGDLTGSVTLTNLQNGTLTATIAPDSVALGTDTTGNYMINVTAGTGVTVSHTQGEGSTATVSIGQSVATTATPTFAGLSSAGGITPSANATYDLGSSTLAWRNVYTNDLHLSNEGHEEGNSVDGTRGNWTIQEGAEDLFIINNKTGKKYKFALEEIQ